MTMALSLPIGKSTGHAAAAERGFHHEIVDNFVRIVVPTFAQ
jgi:hypothetical protein